MRFYGSLTNERPGETTRGGHRHVIGHVRGWDSGVRVTAMEASASSVPGTGDAFVIDLTRGSHDPGGAPYGLVTVAECPNGARRVAVSLDPYGFVAYIQRDGRVTSREDPDAETEDP